jgi:hypothetical protein
MLASRKNGRLCLNEDVSDENNSDSLPDRTHLLLSCSFSSETIRKVPSLA